MGAAVVVGIVVKATVVSSGLGVETEVVTPGAAVVMLGAAVVTLGTGVVPARRIQLF